MEGVHVAVHTFPCTASITPSGYQRARYLTSSKAAIVREMLEHPDVVSVDFDGIRAHSTTGSLSLTAREMKHTFRLTSGAACDDGFTGLTSTILTRTKSAPVGAPSSEERIVHELTITYEVTVT